MNIVEIRYIYTFILNLRWQQLFSNKRYINFKLLLLLYFIFLT